MRASSIADRAAEIWDELSDDRLVLLGVALCLAKGIMLTMHPDDAKMFVEMVNNDAGDLKGIATKH
jgi:hypothetical protein